MMNATQYEWEHKGNQTTNQFIWTFPEIDRGTPSYHPFLGGMVHEINQPFLRETPMTMESPISTPHWMKRRLENRTDVAGDRWHVTQTTIYQTAAGV